MLYASKTILEYILDSLIGLKNSIKFKYSIH